MSVAVTTSFGFRRLLAFELGTGTGQTDMQTDGRTGRQARQVMRPVK